MIVFAIALALAFTFDSVSGSRSCSFSHTLLPLLLPLFLLLHPSPLLLHLSLSTFHRPTHSIESAHKNRKLSHLTHPTSRSSLLGELWNYQNLRGTLQIPPDQTNTLDRTMGLDGTNKRTQSAPTIKGSGLAGTRPKPSDIPVPFRAEGIEPSRLNPSAIKDIKAKRELTGDFRWEFPRYGCHNRVIGDAVGVRAVGFLNWWDVRIGRERGRENGCGDSWGGGDSCLKAKGTKATTGPKGMWREQESNRKAFKYKGNITE